MGRRRGAGSSIKGQIRQELQSRQMAEAIQDAVGANNRISALRYGNFAENGVIKAQYQPQGMSPNLLPQRWAEYEGYVIGGSYNTGGDATASNISNDGIFNFLHTFATTGILYHYPYLDPLTDTSISMWRPVTDGFTYIYSTTAIMPASASGSDRWVGLRVTAASDSSGTSPVVIYETPTADTSTMWLLTGAGGQTRVYAKFSVPSGKPYIKIEHVTRYSGSGAATKVGWNWNMLELVSDYRSFPSKYAAPTPRSGELSIEQMQFGLARNIMPYNLATMAATFDPVVFGDTFSDALDVAGTQGVFRASAIGDGFSFNMNADNNFHRPHITWIPTTAPASERLQVGDTYIASCDVKNTITTSAVTVRLRVRIAPTAADINGDVSANLNTIAFIDFTVPPNTTDKPVRVYVKFTVPSGYTYGPMIGIRGTRASGTSNGLFDEVRVENLMLERLPSGSSQSIPSPFTLPIPGQKDISPHQLEGVYSGLISNATARNIAAGADQIQPVSWGWKYRFVTGDLQSNYLFVPITGLYLVQAEVQMTMHATERTAARMYIFGDVSVLNLAQFNIPGNTTTASILAGSALVVLEGGTGFELHVINNSPSSRTINEVNMWVTRIAGE